MSEIVTKNTSIKEKIKWAIVILVPIIIMFIPTTETFTPELRKYAAITLTSIILFVLNIIPTAVTAMGLMILYVIFNVVPGEVAFGAWTNFIPWMVLGGFLLANVLDRIGLLNRIAYWSIMKTGGTYFGIIAGLGLGGIILNVLAPGRVYVAFAALGYGICKALNLKVSKESGGIMLAAFISSWFPTFFLYNSNFATIQGLGAAVTDVTVTYVQYLYHNIPYVIWYFVLLFLLAKLTKPKEKIDIKDFVTIEYTKLGKITKPEIQGAIGAIILVIFLLTANVHKINIGWGFALIPLLYYVPGLKIGTVEDMQKINYQMVIFVTGALSIGQAASALGLGTLIANALLPILVGKSPYFVFAAIWVTVVISKFFLTPLAVYATLTVPLTEIALNLNIDPLPVYYAMNVATSEIILPYQWALVLIFTGYGMISTKDFVKLWGMKMALSIIFLLAIAVPYWMLIGLI
ncbi:SLC13 family permease [Alkalibaculum sp. M08DMB]|uniref:SLC13 family permease n=1 Tax=Alkalibaculum sporogenes TaxID=2655001 RepID=A0A6A7KAX7_9FIRM|nr:SLC13 family permease [Alkalibaculum sporogenes]MPW26554.1 SLC13 family permease [Alkalibaculum sporogenes]